jgi:calcineurin-binding protein cabin-1
VLININIIIIIFLQEERSLSRYKEALEKIRDDQNQEAEDILLELLGTKLLQEVTTINVYFAHKDQLIFLIQVEKSTGAMQVPASLSLKYSCLKNIGLLVLKRGDESAALDYFFQAVKLDDTDVSLWFRMGCVAEKLDKYNLAATCFLEVIIKKV